MPAADFLTLLRFCQLIIVVVVIFAWREKVCDVVTGML